MIQRLGLGLVAWFSKLRQLCIKDYAEWGTPRQTPWSMLSLAADSQINLAFFVSV